MYNVKFLLQKKQFINKGGEKSFNLPNVNNNLYYISKRPKHEDLL